MQTISESKSGKRKQVIIDGRTCHIRKHPNGWYKTLDHMVWTGVEYGKLNTCSPKLLKPVKEKDNK